MSLRAPKSVVAPASSILFSGVFTQSDALCSGVIDHMFVITGGMSISVYGGDDVLLKNNAPCALTQTSVINSTLAFVTPDYI